MAANFVEKEELQEGNFDQIDTPADQPQEEPPLEVPTEEPKAEDLPEKYKGKSVEDIVKMHQEAEKLIGRQAKRGS
jgi:hypothetical protein